MRLLPTKKESPNQYFLLSIPLLLFFPPIHRNRRLLLCAFSSKTLAPTIAMVATLTRAAQSVGSGPRVPTGGPLDRRQS
ncbi:putative coiled-coil domain-containing protein SCD2 [Iris pallida]|uniref:Coiled-coil domain-containing protein SCD2 n=1 Tax=Iris pallida TaxID=29817 RepID=A0AAX6FGZ2_IRIPA|nr:putative coiled-coil domain-containing protein SCD2 [Iris pallida]KAJ6815670.1 putative coiled-coil domain-containing protein SCD2 [Iris pallida]